MSSSLFVHNRTRSSTSSDISECKSSWTSVKLSRYVQLKFVCAFLVPSLITLTFSFRLLRFLRRCSRKSQYLSVSNRSLNRSKRRATTLVLLIIVSFVVLWSPLWILQLYDTFNQRGPTPYIQILNFLTLVFVYANGLLNPLLYLILTENFRDYLRRTTCFQSKSQRQSTTNDQRFAYRSRRVKKAKFIADSPTHLILQIDDRQNSSQVQQWLDFRS